MNKQKNSNTKSLNIIEKLRMIIKFEFLFWNKKEKEERKTQ